MRLPILLLLTASALAGADLYVAPPPTGSDAHVGTQAAPFATIAKAALVAKPGVTVHVAPGSYAGDIVTRASGTATARIRYVSDVRWGARIASGTSEYAWWNRGAYTDIDDFEIDGTHAPWNHGLYVNGSHTVVRGNKVHDILTDPNAASTRYAMQGDGGAGIGDDNWYGDTDISAIGNVVYNIGPPARQSLIHGIYQVASGTVADNVVSHTSGIGITLWHDAHDIVIANNTVDAALDAGILVGAGDRGIRGGALSARAGDYVTVANNIVANGGGIMEEGIVGTHDRYIDNLCFNCPAIAVRAGTASGTITADPRFVDRARRDFHLQAGSPAIDRAAAAFAPATDFDGVRRPQGPAPDIGAYERPATVGTSTLTLSVDNQYTHLYVNGAALTPGANAANWRVADTFTVSGAVRTVAVRAVNFEPGAGWAGLIAKITEPDGTVVVSDRAWRVFAGTPANDANGRPWYDPAYDDSRWTSATSAGAYGVAPWGAGSGLERLSGAQWIWSGNPATGVSPVYLRVSIVAAPTGSG